MLLTHYAHRLPVDHDLAAIRERAATRGPQWDAVPGLAFKAFLLRERGVLGAAANDYSSLYLWQRTDAFATFLGDERFGAVTGSFGRPAIEVRPVVAALRGQAVAATHLVKRALAIDVDADLAEAFAHERERVAREAQAAGIVAVMAAVDVERWSITRVSLHDRPPEPSIDGTLYTVLYLAAPELASLPRATGGQA